MDQTDQTANGTLSASDEPGAPRALGTLNQQQANVYTLLRSLEGDAGKPFRSGADFLEIQHVAPKEAQALASMALPRLWLLLNEWQPKSDWSSYETGIQEDYDELAARFAQLVEGHPERFVPAEKWWENLKRPAALHKVLDRAVSRIEDKPNEEKKTRLPPTDQDWANWFGIAEWITSQRPVHRLLIAEADAKIRSVDPDWTWSRIVVARFLQVAIETEFLEKYQARLAALIRDLVETEDPRLENKQTPEMNDWLTVAINSVRGRGIEVLLQLALKQKKAARQIEPWIFWSHFNAARKLRGITCGVRSVWRQAAPPPLFVWNRIERWPGPLVSYGAPRAAHRRNRGAL